jgi:hypothetical protein
MAGVSELIGGTPSGRGPRGRDECEQGGRRRHDGAHGEPSALARGEYERQRGGRPDDPGQRGGHAEDRLVLALQRRRRVEECGVPGRGASGDLSDGEQYDPGQRERHQPAQPDAGATQPDRVGEHADRR